MRLSRLAVLSLFLMSLSISANAQYTSKSTRSSETKTKSSETATQSKTNSFTTNSRKTSSAAGKKAPAQPQPSFRPRPQAAAQQKAAETNNDELPSFDVFENKETATTGENLPPPPPPKGEVWVYLADFKHSDLTGMTMTCNWKVIVQNRTDTPISRLSFTYHLLDLKFKLEVPSTKENSSFIQEHAVYNSKCPALARIKPKVNVTKCKFGPLKDQECAEYIVVK